jgi:hypothetical protein
MSNGIAKGGPDTACNLTIPIIAILRFVCLCVVRWLSMRLWRSQLEEGFDMRRQDPQLKNCLFSLALSGSCPRGCG